MRWSSSGESCKHSTIIFSPTPPFPLLLSFCSLHLCLLFKREWCRLRSHFAQASFYCVCCKNPEARALQIKSYNIDSVKCPQHLPCSQKEGKQKCTIWTRDLYCRLESNEHTLCVCLCVCVCKACQWCQRWGIAMWLFTHAAGSSISGNISHSASLTPTALL